MSYFWKKSEVLPYENLQTKFCPVQYLPWPFLVLDRNNSLPSFVSFCDPYSDRVCATVTDDFYKIALLDVMESSVPVYP